MPFCRHVLDTRPKPADSPQLLILFLHSKKMLLIVPFGSSSMTTHSHHRTQCSLPRRSMRRRCPRLRPRAPAPLPVRHRCHTPIPAQSRHHPFTQPSCVAASISPDLAKSPRSIITERLMLALFRIWQASGQQPRPTRSPACTRVLPPAPATPTATITRYPSPLAHPCRRLQLYFSIQILRERKHIYIYSSSSSRRQQFRVTSRWDCGLDSAIRLTCVVLGLRDGILHPF
jgi:hypothetical protein